jgi:hypothetical protein
VLLQGAFHRVHLQGGGTVLKLPLAHSLFIEIECRVDLYISLSVIKCISYLLSPCTFLSPPCFSQDILDFWENFILRKCLSIFAVTIRHIFSRGCERAEFYPLNINLAIVNIFRIFDYFYSKCHFPLLYIFMGISFLARLATVPKILLLGLSPARHFLFHPRGERW